MSEIKRVWKEYSISTEKNQVARISLNNLEEGMILRVEDGVSATMDLNLNYEEALELGKLLRQFANESKK